MFTHLHHSYLSPSSLPLSLALHCSIPLCFARFLSCAHPSVANAYALFLSHTELTIAITPDRKKDPTPHSHTRCFIHFASHTYSMYLSSLHALAHSRSICVCVCVCVSVCVSFSFSLFLYLSLSVHLSRSFSLSLSLSRVRVRARARFLPLPLTLPLPLPHSLLC